MNASDNREKRVRNAQGHQKSDNRKKTKKDEKRRRRSSRTKQLCRVMIPRGFSIPRGLVARHGLQPQKDPRHALKRAGGVRRLVVGVFRSAALCLVSLVMVVVVRVGVLVMMIVMMVVVARVAAAAVDIVDGAKPLERVRLRVHGIVEEPTRVRRRRHRSRRRYRGGCDETIDLDGCVVGLFAQFNPREHVGA